MTCLRIADTLASSGLDARPASAEAIDAVNALLHVDAPIADHWSHLEVRSGFTGVYYANPAHIGADAAQWWTWPLSQAVTTLVRLTPGANGATTHRRACAISHGCASAGAAGVAAWASLRCTGGDVAAVPRRLFAR